MRLIDADVIHGEIDIFNPEGRMSLKNIKRYIDAQPTAYDIDKVVEKLKERASQSCAVLFAAGIQEAISIIKAGEQE